MQVISEACEDLISKLELIGYRLELESEESLNSSVLGRFFVSISDTFVGILNTLKTNLTKFSKTLKRSELREFVESNRLKTSTVNRFSYAAMQDIPCNVPANLSGSYKDAVASVAHVYIKLNAVPTAKTTLGLFNSIFSGVASNSQEVRKTIASTCQLLSSIVASSKPAVQDCQAKFTDKMTVTKPFKQIFATAKEFQDITPSLLELESRLQDVSILVETIDKIETVLKGICNAVSNPAGTEANSQQPTLDRQSLIHLGEIAKSLALVFDSYGLATTRQMQLEHNHVLNINLLYEQVDDK